MYDYVISSDVLDAFADDRKNKDKKQKQQKKKNRVQ